MSNDEQLNIIDSYLERGDCRSAESVWDTFNREQKEGSTTYSRATLEEKWTQIRQKSEELVPEVEKEIDRFLSNESVDEKIAEGLLYRLERVLLRESSFKHGTVSNRVYGKISQHKENVIFAEAEKTVRFHWNQAVALQIATPTISPKGLLPYYTKALEEAKQQLSQYEKNDHYSEPFKDRLRQLVEEAEKHRESLNVAEKSLTSGALIEDYVTTLDYIRKNPADIKIQIYDESGSVTTVASKEDAYKTYSDRALALAQKKLITYMEGGEGRLGIRQLLALGRPREAEAIHAEYLEKFNRLETEFVPDITRKAERQDFFKFKSEIDSQVYVFDEIETEAQRISNQAVSASTRPELMSLWTEYQSNLRRYPLAEGSSMAVKDAYQSLRRRFSVYLFTVADSIDVAIQSGEFVRAKGLIKENNAVLILPIVEGEDVVNRIKAYDQQLDTIAESMADIGTRINDMFARIMTDSATNLMNSLRELRQKHNETLLKSHADYESVVAQVTSRDSAVADIERLRGYLTSPNMLTVESQVTYARAKSANNPLYEPITNELQAYLDFMKAGDLSLNERVVKLRQLATSGMVADENLKGRIASALSEAEKQEQIAIGNERSFNRATNALRSKEFIEVWQSLELIKSPGNKAEEGKWNDLFVESIMHYHPISKPFDVNLLTRLGEMHRKLPDSFVPPRYQVLREVQEARALKIADEMITAYELILTRESGSDADAIVELLNEARTAQFVSESSDLLNQRPLTAGPKDSDFQDWLNDLREFVKKGIDLAREQPTQAVHYYVTCLKLDLLYIQNVTVVSNRNSGATRVEDTVPRINVIIGQNRKNPLNSFDQQVVEVSSKIRAIIGSIDDMNKYVTDAEANIQRFKTTLDSLNNFFGEGMPARDVLRDFTGEYDGYIKTISNALRDKSQSATGNDRYSPKAFLRYAKMLLVNPESKRDIDNFIQLENLKKNFFDQLKTTFETFMRDDETPLNEMVMRLDEQMKDMQSLNNIADNLTGVAEFVEFAGEMRETIPLVEKMRNAIQGFDARTKNFSMRLDGYPMTYDTLDTYSMKLTEEFAQFQEDVNGYFADLIADKVGIKVGIKVGDVGKSHPVVLGFEDKKHTLSNDFATIVSHWTTILNLTNAQEFARALTEMDNFEALKHQFEIFRIKRVYGDKLPTNLKTNDMQIALPSVNGYAGLREWLLGGQKTIELVRIWRNAQTSEGIAVGEFEKLLASAEEYRQSADFNNARQTLDNLINTENRLGKYENIPYLANSQGRQKIASSFDYPAAIRDCPYTEARKIIEQAQKEYQTLLNEIAKIRGIRDGYALAASQYEGLENEYFDVFNKTRRLRGRDRLIQRARAEMLLVQMEQIAPYSRAITNYRKKLIDL